MSEIKKVKNTYEFWIDGKTKPYVYNIDTMQMTGLRGSVLLKVPDTVMRMLYHADKNNVLYLLYHRGVYSKPSTLGWANLLDRLDSLDIKCQTTNKDTLNALVECDFKELVKVYRESPEQDMYYVLREITEQRWLKTNGIKITDHFTADMAHDLYYYRGDLRGCPVDLVLYFMERGLYEYHSYSVYQCIRRIAETYAEGQYAGLPLVKNNDFMRQYINIHRAAKALRDAEKSKGIAAYQNYRKPALAFEDDTFIVVIPTTEAELVAEGNAQNNCVGSYGNAIADKERNVVFIRRKSNPDTPYITCDIRGGAINQYLTRYNHGVYDEDAIAFRNLYAEHIRKNWVR